MNPNDEEDRLNDRKYRNIRISLYLTEGELTEWAREAVKVRARAPQAKVRVKKPHGFANEFEYNTQGIAKFIRKHLFPNWIQTRAERAGKLKELQAEASRMGFRVIDQDEDV